MFTAARICTALSATCTGLLGAFNDIPVWAKAGLMAVGLFTTAIVAISGPVQASATDKVVVKPVTP